MVKEIGLSNYHYSNGKWYGERLSSPNRNA